MKWVKHRDRSDGRSYYTLLTPLGKVWVMYYDLCEARGRKPGWQASMNFDGTESDPPLGPVRVSRISAMHDAERWLARKINQLLLMEVNKHVQ